MERVRVRQRILVHERPVEGEVAEVADRPFVDRSRTFPELIPEHVQQDRPQPAPRRRVLLQGAETPEGLQQRLLHEVLRSVAHQPSRERIEGGELATDQLLKGLLVRSRTPAWLISMTDLPIHLSLDTPAR
jgi:hypothetical protein